MLCHNLIEAHTGWRLSSGRYESMCNAKALIDFDGRFQPSIAAMGGPNATNFGKLRATHDRRALQRLMLIYT